MPKIPRQAGRTVMPQGGGGGGGGSANARGIAGKVGGLQQAGAAVASGAGALGNAFARAAHERDRINAHLDSLNQRTGAYQISMDGAAGLDQDANTLLEKIRANPGAPKITFNKLDGTEETLPPEAAMRRMMQDRVDQSLEYADSVYGPEARLHVAESLTRDARMAQSKFGDEVIKIRHDKTLADYDKTATRMEDRASDITNRFREKDKEQLEDLVDRSVQAGAFSPTQGAKEKEKRMAAVGKKYWTQYAIANPDQMLKIGSERKAPSGDYLTGKAGDPIAGTVAPGEGGQLAKLPEDLDAADLPGYLQLATAVKTRQYNEVEQLDRANTAKAEVESKQAYNESITVSAKQDNSVEIEKNRATLGTRYDDALRYNHEWNNARRVEQTRATTDVSQFTQFELLNKAKMAKFLPELLDPTNPDAITNEVVRQRVIGQKDLLPEHASPILAAINEAQTYHEREDSGKRMAEKDGFALVSKTFFAPQNLQPADAFELKRLEADAQNQLGAEYTKNATGDRNELALNLVAKFTPRVLAVQKASAESIDHELLTMEKAWPVGLASTDHKLNEGTRKQLEKANPGLRGLFKVYDAKVERWNQLIKVGEDLAKEVKY